MLGLGVMGGCKVLISKLSEIPSVDEILKTPEVASWLSKHPRKLVLKAIRAGLDEIRQRLTQNKSLQVSTKELFTAISKKLQGLSTFSLRPVINATGIVIHTNLGRSLLPEHVMRHVLEVATSYSTLEYDALKGKRGKRNAHVQWLLREITGAEDAVIVNNNAGAVLLVLTALAKGKEVIVSRGELVEIGGSFRVPDVMALSGAKLREVGTTNKTHLHDYERAISPETGLLLKVHQSNFKIVGFTQDVSIDELIKLGRTHNIPVMFDLGSGSLVHIGSEPTVQDIVKAGCDIVTFSGDKLLGGPQGGIIVGRQDLISQIASHPLMRALRVDKMTFSAFEAVLRDYLDIETAYKRIPTLHMLKQDTSTLKNRAETLLNQLSCIKPFAGLALREDFSQAGGGSLPEVVFKTYVVTIKPFSISVNQLEQNLRLHTPPIIARIADDTLVLDVRTIKDEDFSVITSALAEIFAYLGSQN